MKVDFSNLGRYAAANKKLITPVPNRIVFFGDSITEFWTSRNGTLSQNPNFINRGISGQTTSQMLGRFQQDVIDLQPVTVVILAGVNDIAENNGPISVEKIVENTVLMIRLAMDSGIKVILCSVLPATSFSWRKDIQPANTIIRLNEMLADYAHQNQITYVDYHTALVDGHKGLDNKYTEDGVHPNANGYKKMEAVLTPYIAKENAGSN